MKQVQMDRPTGLWTEIGEERDRDIGIKALEAAGCFGRHERLPRTVDQDCVHEK